MESKGNPVEALKARTTQLRSLILAREKDLKDTAQKLSEANEKLQKVPPAVR